MFLAFLQEIKYMVFDRSYVMCFGKSLSWYDLWVKLHVTVLIFFYPRNSKCICLVWCKWALLVEG